MEFAASGAEHLVGKNPDVFLEDDFQQWTAGLPPRTGPDTKKLMF